jgi:very-short-patch-repair endonuclease
MELTELSIKGIHVLETSEGLLFKANDIATYLELSNINHNLSSSKLDKIKIKVNTLGGKQYVNFLTLDVVKQIICSSRKSKAIELAKMLNIDINTTFYVPLETSLINFIEEVYKDELIISQYSVDVYFIDIYFPKYKLAIECDEYKHKYTQSEDKIREDIITKKLNCKFIRYKQDINNKNLSKLIYEINNFLVFSKNK